MKSIIYRIALLRILCAMIGGHRAYYYGGKMCEKPKEFVDCAKEFAAEYMKNLRPDVERRKD